MNRTSDVVRARRSGAPWAAAAAAAALAGVLVAPGCGLPAAPAHPRLWTLFDFQRLAAIDDNVALAAGGGIPGGLPVSHFLTADGGASSLALSNAWTEGLPAAYVTTELWLGFDQVWVQPQYVAVTGWDANGKPQPAPDADGMVHPIFGVGPGTAFYSPFWQQIYFQVPAGSAVADFHSERQVIESGVPLHPGGAVVCPLAPPGPIAAPVGLPPFVGPDPIALTPAKGWFDGQLINYFRIGTGTFRWDANRVVQELPLFNFTMADANGNITRIDGAPPVGGTGAIGSGAPADIAASGQPKYGALWRAYTVLVPPTARVFAPPRAETAALMKALGDAAVLADGYSSDALTGSFDVIAPWVGLVAVNPGCFKDVAVDPANVSGSCVWLDSQRAIEREVDGRWIQRTNLLLTCPFVGFNGKSVPL